MTEWRDEMAAALPGARERSGSKIEAQAREMLTRCIEALEMIELAGWRWTGSESGPLSNAALGAAVEAALEHAGMHAAEGRFAFDTDEREALSLPSVEIRREALEEAQAFLRDQHPCCLGITAAECDAPYGLDHPHEKRPCCIVRRMLP